MERLSNKYSDLHNELKIELSTIDLNSDQHCVVKYIEIPWLPGGQTSLSLVEDKLKHTYSLIEKAWNNDYDTKRFSTGIFNLDRLCIKT